MTKNQIEYNKLLETKRANQASERAKLSEIAETGRHNLAGEQIQRASLDETSRANRAREAWQSDTLAETMRSNQERESLARAQHSELQRSNRASEDIRRQQNVETQRSNLARENETHRSNLAKETETQRANIAREQEEHRSNVERERETAEHNDRTEAIDIGRAGTYAADVAARALYYSKSRAPTTNVTVNPVNSQSVGGNTPSSNQSTIKQQGGNYNGQKQQNSDLERFKQALDAGNDAARRYEEKGKTDLPEAGKALYQWWKNGGTIQGLLP